MSTISQSVALDSPDQTHEQRSTNYVELFSDVKSRVGGATVGTRSGWPMRATYLACDMIAIAGSIVVSHMIVSVLDRTTGVRPSLLQLKLYGLLAIGLLGVSLAQRTYAAIPPRPVRHFRGWVLGAMTVCGIQIGAAWLLSIATLANYLALGMATLLAIFLASFTRALCRTRFGKAAWWGTRLIVVGNSQASAEMVADLEREPRWGLRPVGFVNDTPMFAANIDSSRLLGSLDQLDEIAERLQVNRALVTVSSYESEELAGNLCRVGSKIRHWIILPPLNRFPSMWLEECEAARRPAFSVTNRLALPWSSALKRAFDLVLTCLIGIAALPLIIAIALTVRRTSPGPAFFGQERVGRGGRRFTAWKFRTMVVNADAVLANYLVEHPDSAAEYEVNHKLRDDPRVTPIGRWLRKTSLDELPQLWNVLRGEMSLVGPRPILAVEIADYDSDFDLFCSVQPGMTGLWQVSGRNHTTYAEHIELDSYYARNWSPWLDLYILACTLKVVLLREGAF